MIDTFIVMLVSVQPTIECQNLTEEDFTIFEKSEDICSISQEQAEEATYILPSFDLIVCCSMGSISYANEAVLIEGENVQSHLQTNSKFVSR